MSQREPRKIEDYRADSAYLDVDELQLLEEWDAVVARLRDAEQELQELRTENKVLADALAQAGGNTP